VQGLGFYPSTTKEEEEEEEKVSDHMFIIFPHN
jgi:hypothetical protein